MGKPKHRCKDGETYVDLARRRFRRSAYSRNGAVDRTWYEIDRSRSLVVEGSSRPLGAPAELWSKMTKLQQLIDIADYKAGRPRRKGEGEVFGESGGAGAAVSP